MEALYINLKQDRLSPTGELTRDFRGSFIRCCRNDKVNEKLHLVRTLNSTLKAKEAGLLAIEHVLAMLLLQEIIYHKSHQVAAESCLSLSALQTPCMLKPTSTEQWRHQGPYVSSKECFNGRGPYPRSAPLL